MVHTARNAENMQEWGRVENLRVHLFFVTDILFSHRPVRPIISVQPGVFGNVCTFLGILDITQSNLCT